MASIQGPTLFCTRELPPRESPRILREDHPTMLNRLKHQLSRKDKSSDLSLRTPSMKPEENSHPQRNSAPSTRRPAVLPSTKNPFRDMGEAPPPYSPRTSDAPAVQSPTSTLSPSSPASSSSSSVTASTPATPLSPQSQGEDDPYTFLYTFDTIFLIDDSGSMAGSRWRDTKNALEMITPICTAHDADGIDLFFLNSPDAPKNHNIVRRQTVKDIFETVKPGGGTPTGQRLNQILKPYVRRYEKNPERTKPINLICITDGEPSDDVESPLIWAAKKLDKLDAPAWQVGVQFFQVGRDEEAKRHLRQLDDELAEIAGNDELRDIVDTVPFTGAEGTTLTGDGILKVVLGAVNRRLDRKKSKDLHR